MENRVRNIMETISERQKYYFHSNQIRSANLTTLSALPQSAGWRWRCCVGWEEAPRLSKGRRLVITADTDTDSDTGAVRML